MPCLPCYHCGYSCVTCLAIELVGFICDPGLTLAIQLKLSLDMSLVSKFLISRCSLVFVADVDCDIFGSRSQPKHHYQVSLILLQ